MKLRITSTIAVLLALLIANLGFAETGLLLCRNQCQQAQVELPPCCSGNTASHHADTEKPLSSLPDADCPHLDSSSRQADLSFLPPLTKVEVPAATFAGHLPMQDVPPAALLPHRRSLAENFSLPNSTPRYHLYCSLLI